MCSRSSCAWAICRSEFFLSYNMTTLPNPVYTISGVSKKFQNISVDEGISGCSNSISFSMFLSAMVTSSDSSSSVAEPILSRLDSPSRLSSPVFFLFLTSKSSLILLFCFDSSCFYSRYLLISFCFYLRILFLR